MTSLKFEDFKYCKMTTCTFCGQRLLAKSGVALGYIHEVTFFEIKLFGGAMNFGYPSLHNGRQDSVAAHSLRVRLVDCNSHYNVTTIPMV